MQTSRVIFFIDGFNLYHAIAGERSLRRYRWLNLDALCGGFLSRREKLEKILFFTAYYPGKPDRRIKHQTYVRALELTGVEVVLGEFKRKDKYCSHCRAITPGYEEKQTDVNIAIQLFRQAVMDRYDTAFIISGDSDLIPAVKAVQQTFPEKTVKLILPPNRKSESLKNAVTFTMHMKERHLQQHQFPDPFHSGEAVIRKPDDWK